MQIEDGRRVDNELDPAALAALVFALEDDHPVTGIDDLLRLPPVFIPYFVVFGLDDLLDLAEASRHQLAFPEAPDRPVELDVGIDQLGHPVPVPAFQEFLESL